MRGSTAGLAEGTIVTPDTVHAAFLVFLDVMFSSAIAAPVVIAYWRGTWNLMTTVLFPDNMLWSAISSCFIGTIGHFIFYYYQGHFTKSFHPDKHRITFIIISRMYTAIYGVVCVNSWRGGWTLMDLYIPKNVPIYFFILMISCILLAFCKALRNISSSPFAISTDHSKDYFAVPTMFKASVSNFTEWKPIFGSNFFFTHFAANQWSRILLCGLYILSADNRHASHFCVEKYVRSVWFTHIPNRFKFICMVLVGKIPFEFCVKLYLVSALMIFNYNLSGVWILNVKLRSIKIHILIRLPFV